MFPAPSYPYVPVFRPPVEEINDGLGRNDASAAIVVTTPFPAVHDAIPPWGW
jgi:hypothetical protein